MSIKGQGHSLTIANGHSVFKIKTCFSQNQLGHLKPNFIWSLLEKYNENLYKWNGLHV